MTSKPKFFKTGQAFRRWLDRYHASKDELLVGYYKVGSGKASMTWSESVDQALCYGWIDGIRRRIDDESYSIRFTPRRQGSKWSDVNLKKVEQLTADGLMMPAGVAAFERRVVGRRAGYAYEEKPVPMTKDVEKVVRKNRKAWEFFEAQPPSYRKKALFWLASAKKEETRARRLAQAIASWEKGER